MTAPIIGHWGRKPNPAKDDFENYAARMADGDAGMLSWTKSCTRGQLWSRVAEGRKQVWS